LQQFLRTYPLPVGETVLRPRRQLNQQLPLRKKCRVNRQKSEPQETSNQYNCLAVETRFTEEGTTQITEESIQVMLRLASRIREETGGDLDDSAIQAVSEATGAPVDYVRLAVRAMPAQQKKRNLVENLKASFLAFDPFKRRLAMGGILGMAAGVAYWLGAVTQDQSGLTGLLALSAAIGSLYNTMIARDKFAAGWAGAIAGGIGIFTLALLSFISNPLPFVPVLVEVPPWLLPFVVTLAAGVGIFLQQFLTFNRTKLGLRDPVQDRQELLTQLLELTDRLKSDEQFATFLSIDMVGSTKIKAECDPLNVEFTFNEYQRFIEAIVVKNQGRIHSTAGDGVTAVFESPQSAYRAGRAIHSGLFEFNAFRNRLGREVTVRSGIHTGNVLAPGKDTTSVNFAHVIDIAAHLQKVAPAGAMVVSEATAVYLPGGASSVSSEKVETQDVTGYVWRPLTLSTPVLPVGAPPIPKN
jgi:class 3 adenylate cyclase